MTIATLTSQPSGARRLAFNGPLTIYDAEAIKAHLHAALQQTKGVPLELDLAAVTDIDLAGLQLLLLARRESLRLELPLRIIAASAAVREVIGFCHLGDFFGDTLAPDPED